MNKNSSGKKQQRS
jgi:hypothetical protein